MIRLLIFILLAFSSLNASSQQIFKPDSIKRHIKAMETKESIRLDGRLNEPAWHAAAPVSSFIQVEPFQEQKANDSTEVRVIFDSKHIYVSVFCHDTFGKRSFRAPDLKRDFEWRAHDTFAIAFDGFNDQRNSVSFATNPYAAQKDYLSFDDVLFDGDWNGLWQVRTSRSDSGWVAEFAIPWKTLRYAKKENPEWGINFLRLRRNSNEISVWSKYPRAFGFNRMDYAGILEGIHPPPPGLNIQANPYFLLSNHEKDGVNNLKAKAGGEIKWAINTNTIADFTFNTDFAQADADLQVNNITRFSVFFPEKRQFFLENASLFGVGISPDIDLSGGNMRIQPFFSRKIGLDSSGNPIPIDAGARVVYRSLKRSAGGMWVRQHEYSDAPAANFGAFRFTENIGKQNRIGAVATIKSEGSRFNNVIAIDGFFRIDQKQSINTMVIHSSTSEMPQGLAGYSQYIYNSNNFKFWLTESFITKNFNAETGFISRGDVVATTPGIIWYYRGSLLPYKKIIRSFEPSVSSEFYHAISSHELIERSINIRPFWLNLQSGGFFGTVITPTYQNLTASFDPLGVSISPGQYNYTRYSLQAGSNPSKKISYLLQYDLGNYFGGQLTTQDVQLRYSPLPNIAVSLRYNDNYFVNVGEQQETKHVTLYTSQVRLALTPRLQLTSIIQKNTQTNTNSYNIKLAWEYKPLSYIYFVYNNRVNTIDRTLNESNEILKISFLKQF